LNGFCETAAMMDNRALFRVFAGLLLLVALAGAPAVARGSAPTSRPVVGVVIADSVSVNGFVRYWKSFANRADRVVLIVAIVAAAAVFIITRGKWLK
jgi:hypothetical protein